VLAAVARSGTRPVSRSADELTDRQVNIQRGLQIVPYKIIDGSDVHGGRYHGGPSMMGRGGGGESSSFLLPFMKRSDENQLIEANYEQFVLSTDTFWSLLVGLCLTGSNLFIYLFIGNSVAAVTVSNRD